MKVIPWMARWSVPLHLVNTLPNDTVTHPPPLNIGFRVIRRTSPPPSPATPPKPPPKPTNRDSARNLSGAVGTSRTHQHACPLLECLRLCLWRVPGWCQSWCQNGRGAVPVHNNFGASLQKPSWLQSCRMATWVAHEVQYMKRAACKYVLVCIGV